MIKSLKSYLDCFISNTFLLCIDKKNEQSVQILIDLTLVEKMHCRTLLFLQWYRACCADKMSELILPLIVNRVLRKNERGDRVRKREGAMASG